MTTELHEPPPWVRKRTLWQLATCVIGDHVADQVDGAAMCVRCVAPWPCACRRLADQALAEAERKPRVRPVRNQAYLDWLRESGAARSRPDP
jgi:hypothetical protein